MTMVVNIFYIKNCYYSDCCQGNRAHYDLGLAREIQRARGGRSDYLILHLSELVRVAFMAATSDSDHLKLEGLRTMEVRKTKSENMEFMVLFHIFVFIIFFFR